MSVIDADGEIIPCEEIEALVFWGINIIDSTKGIFTASSFATATGLFKIKPIAKIIHIIKKKLYHYTFSFLHHFYLFLIF